MNYLLSRLSVKLLAIVIVILGIGFSPVHAAFPAVGQVNADYTDDAERFAAFNILYDAFMRSASKPLSSADYATQFSYQASSNMIATQQMTKDGAGSQAYRDFNTRCNQLISDPVFTRAVFDKYQLGGLPAAQRAPPAIVANEAPVVPRPAPAPAPVVSSAPVMAPVAASPAPAKSSSLVDSLLRTKVPISQRTFDLWMGAAQMSGAIFIVAMLIFFGTCAAAMAFAAWLVLRRSGVGRKIYPVPGPMAGGLPALPQNLQVVSLGGVRYAVYVLSGQVLETKSIPRTSSYTTTTGGGTFQTPHGNVYNAPVTTTHTSTTVENIIWVRQPNGVDAQWSIYDGNFQYRIGHIISVLVRQGKDGGYILAGYNHSMDALTLCPELEKTHSAKGNELGQWAANIAGGVVAWQMMKIVWNSSDETGIIAGFAVYWLVATFILVTISFLILTPLVKWRILKKRTAQFKAKYLPGYRAFFQQGTAILRR